MKHLSQTQLDTLRTQLKEQQEKLQTVWYSLEKTDPANDPERLNENSDLQDDATEDVEMVRHESLKAETQEMINRVAAALERMDKGTYGIAHGGEQIPYERLLVDPTAETIVTQA